MNDKSIIELKDGYLLIIAKGVRDNFEEVIEGTKKIREAALAYDMKYVIVDYRKLDFNVSMADAFNIVKVYEDLPEFNNITVAAITNRKNLELGQFWESICIRRGYQYKVFTELEKGADWIKHLIKTNELSS